MPLSWIYIIIASIIWAVDWFVRKSVGIPSLELIALEMTLTSLIIGTYVILFARHEIRKINNFRHILGLVVLSGIIWSWCFMQSLQTTNSLGIVFVLIGLQPVFTIFSSALLLKEHPKSSFYAFAATTIFCSILLTLWDTGLTLDMSQSLSYIYALCTAICWWTSTSLIKIITRKNSSIYIILIRSFFTALTAWWILLLSYSWQTMTHILRTITFEPIKIGYVVILWNIIASLSYYKGIRKIPASLTAIFELSFPLTGFLLDFFLYDVFPSPIKILASIVILGSIIILPYCHFIEENKAPQAAMA